jgi:hypothetical protein
LSYRGKLVSAVLLLAALGSCALWACGAFFPNWLLWDENGGVLATPTTWLREAVQPLLPQARPAFAAAVDPRGPLHQTAMADRKDLEDALAGLPLERRQAVIGAYMKVRYAIVAYRTGMVVSEEPEADPTPPEPASLTVPPGLPGEFEDYLRGAIAWHQGKPDAARAAWETLLARPEGERRRRSTWAAFMLGKALVESDPPAAIRWFERTRELASQGFSDPLGLAAASVGWQARAEVNRRRFDEALQLYLQQHQAGDPTALQSIRDVGNQVLNDPQALQQVAHSPEARPILTAFVISNWDHERPERSMDPEKTEEERKTAQHYPDDPHSDDYEEYEYFPPLSMAPARKWLAAIRAAGVTRAEEADRFAWLAYRSGDFDAAEEWLKRAPADAPMALWVRAKLLLRAGKLAEAEPLLARVRAALPASPPEDHIFWNPYEAQLRLAFRPQAAGELGAVRLSRGDYEAALDDLLRGGWWTDAAYVAERVLTVDELRAYVDRTWSAELAAQNPEEPRDVDDLGNFWETQYAGIAPPPDGRAAYDVRYLLGRRLARAGRLAEARPYLPEELQPYLDDLARSLAAGRDAGRPAAERSRALFRAACLTRYQGMELLGTEVDPDWHLFDGGFGVLPFVVGRSDPKTHQHLLPTADERRRVERSQAVPVKRFHYRYQGMDLALEAAKLLPPGEERARLLATAGNWVEGKDPRGARPLYDAIQSCCANTEIARRSRKAHAITNVQDACPEDTEVVWVEEGEEE